MRTSCPGLIYNAGYAALMALSNLVGWPVVGFMVGSVAGDPTDWHRDTQDRPAVPQPHLDARARRAWHGSAVQLPIWLAGKSAEDPSPMIAALGVTKIAMGWPLQILALAGMAWLLARNHTPVTPEADGRGAESADPAVGERSGGTA